jgi:hypothetical protein
MDNIKHERDMQVPCKVLIILKLYKLQNNKIDHNTIQIKQHKHQTQLFTKFYDMDKCL